MNTIFISSIPGLIGGNVGHQIRHDMIHQHVVRAGIVITQLASPECFMMNFLVDVEVKPLIGPVVAK